MSQLPLTEIQNQLKTYISQINQAIASTTRLRSCLESAYQISSAEAPNEKFYPRIKEKLIQVQSEYSDLEKAANMLIQKRNGQTPQENSQFGAPFLVEPSQLHQLLGVVENQSNIDWLAQLSLDSTHDKHQLYLEILHAYQWNTRLREHCQLTFLYAQQNSTKRWSSASNHISGRRRAYKQLGQQSSHIFKSSDVYEHMLKLVNQLQAIFAGLSDAKLHPVHGYMNIQTSNSRVLEVTVQHTMRVLIVLRGYLVENIIVRGLDEVVYLDNGDVDLDTPTRYEVFRRVNKNATAAMQYYVFPTGSFDTNLKTLLAWLRSYRTLFTDKCRKCQKFFDKEGVVPTWRDFKVLTAFHDGCRSVQ